MIWTETKDPRIKRRGEIYWARFSKLGIRIQASLSTENFNTAKDLADKIERAILNQESWRGLFKSKEEDDNNTPLIEGLFPIFLEDKSSGNPRKGINKSRGNTILGYTTFWERYFKDFWGQKSMDEITEDEWENYIIYARAKSHRKDQLKLFNHWKIINAFLTWAVKTDRLDKKPRLYNPDTTTFQSETEDSDGIGTNYTDAQLLSFRKSSEYYPAFHLWIIMAQYMGMRSSEITQLRMDRIKLSECTIKLRMSDTKTKQARTVPIHPKVLGPLKVQMAQASGHVLFPNRVDINRPMDTTGFKKPWNKIRAELGIQGRFHDFRHSFATRVFGNPSINPVVSCKALGMSMSTAMKHYIHFSDDQLSALNSFEMAE